MLGMKMFLAVFKARQPIVQDFFVFGRKHSGDLLFGRILGLVSYLEGVQPRVKQLVDGLHRAQIDVELGPLKLLAAQIKITRIRDRR